MKDKNGFTMVELLGVVAIIAAILLFTAPSIIGMLKRDKEKEKQRFLDDLYLAAETYTQLNIDKYPELSTSGGSVTISMHTLIENGYVKASTVNPENDKVISDSDTIVVTKNADGSYSFTYTAN